MGCRYYKPKHQKMCSQCVCKECPRADEDECRLFWMGVADECDRDRPNAILKCIKEWTHYDCDEDRDKKGVAIFKQRSCNK